MKAKTYIEFYRPVRNENSLYLIHHECEGIDIYYKVLSKYVDEALIHFGWNEEHKNSIDESVEMTDEEYKAFLHFMDVEGRP